ncbi:hypothetical protein [Caulobacter segnis]|uniref:hypothetical protein n=1 Tax=Caulobacter segnis TaxID=88688 RepID=UPI0028581BA3|nr:hypothetical protein [Caulobacter segnis]MDR6624847.1 hypothetical protein [Caulobacter segnis]
MPKFFIPFAETAEIADQVYSEVRKYLSKVAFTPTDRKIYSVHYRHNGRSYVSTVGEVEAGEREKVIAIFETFNPDPLYMICTPSRGAVWGDPILAGDVQQVIDFDPTRDAEFPTKQ